MTKKPNSNRTRSPLSFRVGKVRAFMRGRVWYLYYHEHGKRYQPRVGPDKDQARQMAAEINAQLEAGAPSALGFEPISIPELRQRWLDHHENVRRSSLQTINRYRTATQHLMDFLKDARPLKRASDLRPCHAEEFIGYLRRRKVAPNGHRHARKRPLRDTGIKYILETCSALLNYAQRHRHLSPYAENPFRTIEISRMAVEDSRPVEVLDEEQERSLLDACDEWQFPIYLTLLVTGLRPGELVHLLLPDDLDLDSGWLHIRNKPALGWQVKTRNERDIPLTAQHVGVLRYMLKGRDTGPVFVQRRCFEGYVPPLLHCRPKELQQRLGRRILESASDTWDREAGQRTAKTIWRDAGALRVDWIRIEFMRLTKLIGIPQITAPKTLRHTFATTLQDANVDPLIRNELMGHAPAYSNGAGSLGMTAVYTHTRPETKRKQLEVAIHNRPAVQAAEQWLRIRPQELPPR